jgi:cytochrome P450
MIDERRHGDDSSGNLLSMMLAHRDETGQGLSDAQLRDHAVTLFAAGHETTAVLLSWVWYLLLRHPEVYAAVQGEVDEVLGDRVPTFEDLPRLGETLRVIKETLRLYPPGYLQGRAPLRDVEVEGYRLRKDGMILFSPFVLHHDEKLFPEPERFLPERFLPEAEKQRPRSAYMPFGTGPHSCIGNHFALMEAHLLIAAMAQRVRFELQPGQEVRPLTGLTLRPSPYRVRVHRRQGPPRQAS